MTGTGIAHEQLGYWNIQDAASNQIIKLRCSGILYRNFKQFSYCISQLFAFLTFNLKINLCNHSTYRLFLVCTYITLPGKLVNTIFEKELPYFKAALLLHKSAILFAHSISFFPLISAIRVAKTKLTQYPLCNFAKICVRGGIGLQGERW